MTELLGDAQRRRQRQPPCLLAREPRLRGQDAGRTGGVGHDRLTSIGPETTRNDCLEKLTSETKESFREGKLKGRKLARRWYATVDELRDYCSQPEAEILAGGV